jgi:PAS domain S-box-containing protein
MLAGAGLAFITGEALTPEAIQCLVEALAQQPTWSDIPVVVLTSGGDAKPANADALAALGHEGNVTLIERPVRVMTLLSTFRSALRARRRQYDVRESLNGERNAKEALRQSEERLRIALDAARLGAWQLDLATRRLDCTSICKTNFGLPPDAAFSYDALLAAIHPDDRAGMLAAVERALGKREAYRAEYRVFWPDGSLHWILASGRAHYDESGAPRSMVGVTLDITERKRAEEEREQLLTRERAARSEAEAASRLKDEFLATVSHELRTPLTAMLGWAHLLRVNQLDEEGREHAVTVIERNARSQQQLIEDLLDVSRIITGKLRLDVRPIDPAALIEAAVEAVLPAAEAKRIRIRKMIDTGASFVSGDPARLQQVVWNLLSNAIKFTPHGGNVAVQLKHINAHVEISITDSGDGIKSEFLPFVFDRFRQADGSTSRLHGGLGLGLAIVRHLVELHGGTVRAESEGEGQGATFTVNLPLMPVYRRATDGERAHPAARAKLVPIEGADDLGGLKVLVVDDEIDTLELISVSLAQCGATVTTASSSAEALRQLEHLMPDAIISDIGMPLEDGFEFMRKVRELPPERGGTIPAVALTAYARAEDSQRAKLAGYQVHVPKPVELAELVAIVASVAGRT